MQKYNSNLTFSTHKKRSMLSDAVKVNIGTNFCYHATERKNIKFNFIDSTIIGDISLDYKAGEIKRNSVKKTIRNHHIISENIYNFNFSLNNHDKYKYLHLIILQNYGTVDEKFEPKLYATPNCPDSQTMIGFANSFSNYDNQNILVYGFRDGSRYEISKLFNRYGYLPLSLSEHKLYEEEECLDLEKNTQRILSEMLYFYRSSKTLDPSHKTALILNLFKFLNRVIKISRYKKLNLGYSENAILEEVLRPIKIDEDAEFSNNLLVNNYVSKSILNSRSKKEINVQNKTNVLNIDNYLTIIKDFRSYSSDLVKMMSRPVLADYLDSQVKSFNLLCLEIEHKEKSISYSSFFNEWTALQSYADKIKLSHFNNDQKQNIKDAKIILDRALHENTNENEVKSSIKGLLIKLEGILPVNDEVISWLKYETGVKEIEA